MHVICAIPNASHRIDGKLYVPVKLNDETHLVSERMSEAEANRLLQIPGFQPWRGDPKIVEQAITQFKQTEIKAVEDRTTDKDQTIRELQRCVSKLSDDLGQANLRIMELVEENTQLKKQIGEPTLQWNRKRLAEYAESMGLVVNNGNSKEEILDMIDTRVAQRG